MSTLRNWNVMKTAGVFTNLQVIQYLPEKHILRFSFAEVGTPAYLIEPTEVLTDTLFSLVGIEGPQKSHPLRVSIYPNPCHEQTRILIESSELTNFSCSITDIKGKQLQDFGKFYLAEKSIVLNWETGNTPNGIYLFRVEYLDIHSGIKKQIIRKIVKAF
jgi:hypothetical protein